jgi:hypothetical protein
MTDKEVMQMALDALEQITPDWRTSIDKHQQLNNSIEALRAALAQPEPEPVAWISHNAGLYHGKPDELLNPLPLYTAPPQREWVGLTRDQVSEIWVNGCYEFDPMHAIQTFARAIESKLKTKNISMAVMVEEQQRMAKRIEELTQLVTSQGIRLMDAEAQPEFEPVAWISTSSAKMIHWTSDKPAYGDDWIPLYTAPPQREWVGLTDEEIKACAKGGRSIGISFHDAIRKAEAKLREKNET